MTQCAMQRAEGRYVILYRINEEEHIITYRHESIVDKLKV